VAFDLIHGHFEINAATGQQSENVEDRKRRSKRK
jgi:hypothetical protein